MSASSDNLTRARDAAKLSQKTGLTGKALGAHLGVTTQVAHALVGVGVRLGAITDAALTPSEERLLRCIAECERRNLAHLNPGSVTSYSVACAAGKSQGWPGSVSAKRLRSGVEWCARTRTSRPTGLGLIDFTGNGYIGLTPLGWLVVHALEAAAPSLAAGEPSEALA